MATELEEWARAEREFINEEIKWLRAGGRVTSPSGENMTAQKIKQLEVRREHADKALAGQAWTPNDS